MSEEDIGKLPKDQANRVRNLMKEGWVLVRVVFGSVKMKNGDSTKLVDERGVICPN